MVLDLQFRIKNNPNYQNYLREHSYWYKRLNRDPSQFKLFEEEVKDVYQLRTTDRISKFLDTFEMISALLSTLK